ncbi:hypothetical protein LCGC14_2446670, partial [marine sediment metagenome]
IVDILQSLQISEAFHFLLHMTFISHQILTSLSHLFYSAYKIQMFHLNVSLGILRVIKY